MAAGCCRTFAEAVAGDEVAFRACSYRDLLASWTAGGSEWVRAHATTIAGRFDL